MKILFGFKSNFVLLTGMALAACQAATTAPTENAMLIEEGRSIAQNNCTSCHTLGATGDSPRADAPPMRTVLAENNATSLADDFREHIHVGHADMPDFDFNVKETESLLAYIESIQTQKSSK